MTTTTEGLQYGYHSNGQRVEAGEGYRLLAADEVSQLGDEYHTGNPTGRPQWRAVYGSDIGRDADEITEGYPISRAVRRRVEQPASAIPPERLCTDPDYRNLDCGEGWRWLHEGEDVLPGDEAWQEGEWELFESRCGTYCQANDVPIRRRIDLSWRHPRHPRIAPGEGHRLITPGEMCQPGDESSWDGNVWNALPSQSNLLHGEPYSTNHCPIRRRLTTDTPTTPPTPATPPAIERILTPALIEMVNRAPGFPQLYGMLRAHTRLPIPQEVMGESQRIKDWLINNMNPNSTPPPAAPRPRDPDATRDISFEITEDVSGSTPWTRTDRLTGSMEVPESVILDGQSAVERYIREAYTDGDVRVRRHHGDVCHGDDGDDDGSYVSDVTLEEDIDDLIADIESEDSNDDNA